MPNTKLPAGFRFAGVAAGIKASGKPDVSLIVGDHPFVAAGVYTQNQVVAAPVVLCRERTPGSSLRAVITNSGNANACTGKQGDQDANAMCQQVADAINASPDDILVMSTGVIGQNLPMEKVTAGITQAVSALGDQASDFLSASDAILTTDKSRKTICGEIEIDGRTVRIAAMAKGAGMIAPNMATMLAVVMTDAILSEHQATEMIRKSADVSFNQVSVDGHSSTNDTLLLLASGQSGVEIEAQHVERFETKLQSLCISLAKELVADGEGATHVMRIEVSGASNDEDANVIARAIGESPLVKTAITGADPNWGRIVSAAGYAGPKIVPTQTTLRLDGTIIYQEGAPTEFDAATLSKTMAASQEVSIELSVGGGTGRAIRWASDLTVEYVRFNSEYTT